MKICGIVTLPENFKWTPHMLLAMTKEIDKICPEEGTFTQHTDIDLRNDDQNNVMMTD
jgi:hypothetical protein